MANRIEDDFFDQARIMSYKELVSANELAIEKNFNRSLNIKKFIAAVKKFGYNPDSVIFPVLPLMLHEHANGESVEPHIRIKIIGPFNEEGLIIEAVLDCPLESFNKLSVYDIENRTILKMN